MRDLKIHIKYKGRALCGTKAQKRKLKYASDAENATCANCLRDART